MPGLYTEADYEKFKEACDLKALRAAADFRDYNTMLEALKRWLADPTLREKAGKAAGVYVLDNIGATDQVLEKLVVREP